MPVGGCSGGGGGHRATSGKDHVLFAEACGQTRQRVWPVGACVSTDTTTSTDSHLAPRPVGVHYYSKDTLHNAIPLFCDVPLQPLGSMSPSPCEQPCQTCTLASTASMQSSGQGCIGRGGGNPPPPPGHPAYVQPLSP